MTTQQDNKQENQQDNKREARSKYKHEIIHKREAGISLEKTHNIKC